MQRLKVFDMYAAFALNYGVLIYEKVLSRIVFAVFVN